MKKGFFAASVLVLAFALIAPVAAQTSPLIKNGNVLTWSTNTGQNGTLTIANVTGQYFEANQINEKNKAAGTIKLYGAILDNGQKIVLINNSQWKEIWEGAATSTEINGSLTNGSAKYTFKIAGAAAPTPAPQGSIAPFANGKTLKWSTGAGQNGTLLVTSVNGLTFTLDQINFQNRGAGTTKLTGEFKNGQIYIYNKQWNETWTGTTVNNVLNGKINGGVSFKINE